MIYSANYEDLGEIIGLCTDWAKESGKDKEIDVVVGSEFIIDNWKEAPILIHKEDPEGDILGFVCLQMDKIWWNGQDFLSDYMWYIRPEHRGQGIFKKLVNAVKDLGKLNKIPVVLTFLSHGDRTETKMKMFEKHEFTIEGFIARYDESR